jgi:hypothetical protein
LVAPSPSLRLFFRADRNAAALRKRLEARLLELQQQRQAVILGQQQAASSAAAAASIIENRFSVLRQALETQKQALFSSYSSDETQALQQLLQVPPPPLHWHLQALSRAQRRCR